MADDLIYKIKTIADLQAVERSKNALEGVRKTLEKQGKESTHVTQKLREMDKALDTGSAKALKLADAFNQVAAAERKAGRDATAYIAARNQALKGAGLSAPGRLGEAALAFRGAGGGLSGISAAAGTFGPHAAAGAAAAIVTYKAASKAVREFAAAEQSVVKMDAALAQAGLLTEDYRKKLQAMTDQLQSTTAIADEEWAGVITRLTQFGATPDTINKSVEAVKNLAGILYGDLQTAAMAVGKAMQGEYHMFSRLGIEIDKTKSKAEQFDQVCRELATRGHGMLEASAKSLNGQLQTLKNSFGNLMEAAGGHFTRLYHGKQTLNLLSTAFDDWAKRMGGTIPVSGDLENQLRKTNTAMEDGVKQAKAYSDELQKVKEKSDEAATSTNKYLQELAQQNQLKNDEDTAAAELKIAEIKRKEKEGLLTPAQSALAQRQVRESLESVKQGREADLRSKTIEKLEGLAAGNMQEMDLAKRRAEFEESKVKQFENHEKEGRRLKKRWDQEIASAENSGDIGAVESLKQARADSLKRHSEDGGGGDVSAQRVLAEKAKGDAEALITKMFPQTSEYLRQANQLRSEQAPRARIFELQRQMRLVESGGDIGELQNRGPNGPAPRGGFGPTMSDEEFRTGRHLSARRPTADMASMEATANNLRAANEFFSAVVNSMTNMERMSEAHKAAAENAARRVLDTDRKIQIIESQMRHIAGR